MPIDGITVAFYLSALATLAIAHLILTMLLRPRLRFAPSPEGPRCQACGYILFQDQPETCPECGRDRRIDRVRKSAPRPTPPIAAILASALLLFPLSIVAGYPIAARFPQVWTSEGQQLLDAPKGKVEIWMRTRGRDDAREIRWAQIRILGVPSQRSFDADLHAMTLKSFGRRYRDLPPVPITSSGIGGLLAGNGQDITDPGIVRAADEIVASLQDLRDNKWPDHRFVTEMTGHYLIDPDDNGGPFFWLPTYALACVPLWLVLTTWASWRPLRRYRAAVRAYQRAPSALVVALDEARA